MDRQRKFNLLKKFIIVLLTLAFCIAIVVYYVYTLYFVSTDDAYIAADVVQISSRIHGQVTNVLVKDNQHVQKGDLLFQLDKESYELSVARSIAQIDIAHAAVTLATNYNRRVTTLVSQNVSSQQSGEDTYALKQGAEALVQLTDALLKESVLHLQFTDIRAPASGFVTNMKLQPGNVISAGQPQFAIVRDQSYWVDANFKETDLKQVKVGLPVQVTLDLYPGIKFNGVVESLSAGSGNAFSLLPAQNATGNWVKVTQRVPVKVRLINPDPNFQLRIGTSAFVKIKVYAVPTSNNTVK